MNEAEEIKDRLPIEQVVSKYVPLKRAGRVYKGLCPFHGEKTPSFTVNPERNIYKCFGCGKGGDIFDFTMEIEGLSFPEALKLLADQAGIQLEERTLKAAGQAPSGPRKDRLFALNSYVAKLWNVLLTQHPKAEAARFYLKHRGVTPAIIEKFQIGYAPLGTVTTAGLAKSGFTREEIQAAGDPARFQDRIIFPIADITGRTVGFTGRLLELPDDPKDGTSRGPKYWNTPETPLFAKSKTVFALHLAKHAIQKNDIAILAEGQMDVVMLHQAGFAQAVASSGTALTAQQLRLISRFSKNVAFAYDGDKAGREATKRGLELALEEELNPYVIVIPNGKDPAECIQKDPAIWQNAYENRISFMEWLLQEIVPNETILTPQFKKEAAKQLLPWLQRIQDPIERADWLRLVAGRLQTDKENLELALERSLGRAVTPQITTPIVNSPQDLNPLQKRAEVAVALLLNYPESFAQVKDRLDELKLVSPTPFLDRFLAAFDPSATTLETALERAEEKERLDLLLESESRLKDYQEAELGNVQAASEILLILGRIRSDSKDRQKAEVAKQISAAQAAGDLATVKKLLADLKNML